MLIIVPPSVDVQSCAYCSSLAASAMRTAASATITAAATMKSTVPSWASAHAIVTTLTMLGHFPAT